jgi:hypothetical protein
LKEISEIDVLIPEELVKEQVLCIIETRNFLPGCVHDQYADILRSDHRVVLVFHRDGLEG